MNRDRSKELQTTAWRPNAIEKYALKFSAGILDFEPFPTSIAVKKAVKAYFRLL